MERLIAFLDYQLWSGSHFTQNDLVFLSSHRFSPSITRLKPSIVDANRSVLMHGSTLYQVSGQPPDSLSLRLTSIDIDLNRVPHASIVIRVTFFLACRQDWTIGPPMTTAQQSLALPMRPSIASASGPTKVAKTHSRCVLKGGFNG